MKRVRNFASDNNSGCPEVLEVIEECNREHAPGYGDDEWTRRASDALREVFQSDCEVFFVFNGTAEFPRSVEHMPFISQYLVPPVGPSGNG